MEINKLFDIIDNSLEQFQGNIPETQKRIFDELMQLCKDLKTHNGRITNSIENFKLLSKIKQKLENIVVDKKYKSQLKKFLQTYNQVADVQNAYFSTLGTVGKSNTGKLLKEIQNQSIESSLKYLSSSGVNANVIGKAEDILRQNITSGGRYADLVTQMRDYIVGSDKNIGALERYTKLITTDALNQYSRQYMNTVTEDLGLEWYMYVGGLKEKSREWCKHLTDKTYIHKSELNTIIHKHIDDTKIGSEWIPLNPKTKLPKGMIEGTNEFTVLTYAGGYNCGHKFVPVHELAVPQAKRDKVYSSEEYKKWSRENKKVNKEIEKEENNTIKDLDNIKSSASRLHLDLTGGLLTVVGDLVNRSRKIITNYEKKQLINIKELSVITSHHNNKLYARDTEKILAHELETINKLLKLKYDVLFMPKSFFKKDELKYDVIIFENNRYFKADLKEIKSKNIDTIANTISHGGTQAGNVIVDIKSNVDANTLASGIESAARTNKEMKSIMVFYKGKKKTYYRDQILSKRFVTDFYNDFHK